MSVERMIPSDAPKTPSQIVKDLLFCLSPVPKEEYEEFKKEFDEFKFKGSPECEDFLMGYFQPENTIKLHFARPEKEEWKYWCLLVEDVRHHMKENGIEGYIPRIEQILKKFPG